MLRHVILAVAMLSMLAACGDKEEKGADKPAGKGAPAKADTPEAKKATPPAEAPPAALEMVDTDLEPAGVKATMQAPKGATVKESFGVAQIAIADGTFDVEVSSGKSDMAARKKEIGANDINKLKNYIVEDDDALMYESEVMGTTEYHVLVNIEGGEEGFDCEDTKGKGFTRPQAQAMFDACKSIKAK